TITIPEHYPYNGQVFAQTGSNDSVFLQFTDSDNNGARNCQERGLLIGLPRREPESWHFSTPPQEPIIQCFLQEFPDAHLYEWQTLYYPVVLPENFVILGHLMPEGEDLAYYSMDSTTGEITRMPRGTKP